MRHDAYFGLYEWGPDELATTAIEDSLPVAKVMGRWGQDDAFAPRRLLYKRGAYIPRSPAEAEEASATDVSAGAHHTAFLEAEHHFVHGHYRMDPHAAAHAAACLLAAQRGGYHPSRDTLDSVRPLITELLPLYALKGPCVPPREGHQRGHGIGQASTALTVDDMALRVLTHLRDIAQSGAGSGSSGGGSSTGGAGGGGSGAAEISPLLAQRLFLAACKNAAASTYGREIFPGKRTWKEARPAPAAAAAAGAAGQNGAGSGAAPGTPGAAGAAAAPAAGAGGGGGEVARSEDIFVAVGHAGIALLGAEDPLRVDAFPYAAISKWVVSRDGKIFAFNLDNDRIIYIVTESAPFIERAVERYVEEMVRFKSARTEADRWAQPRLHTNPAVAGMAAVVSLEPRFVPPYALVPSPEEQASFAARMASGIKAAALLGLDSPSGPVAGAGGGPVRGASTTGFLRAHVAAETGAAAAAAAAAAGRAAPVPQEPLPPHWRPVRDAEGDTFYYNERTGESTWQRPKPVPLPLGWVAAQDGDGDTFYVNTATGESSWFPPDPEAERRRLEAGLPPDWTVQFDSEGDPFYVHLPTATSSWYRPRPDGSVPSGP